MFRVCTNGHKGLCNEPGELHRRSLQPYKAWLADLTDVSESDSIDKELWPLSSNYYDRCTMDANFLIKFILYDCVFYRPGSPVPWSLDLVDFSHSTPLLHQSAPGDTGLAALVRKSTASKSLLAVFFSFQRAHHPSCTKAFLSIDAKTWTNLLAQVDLLPSFLELLHNNSGGCTGHLTTNSLGTSDLNGANYTFHFGIKFGRWAWEEGAIYARHELRTGRKFALFAATSSYGTGQGFFQSFEGCSELSIPEIVIWFTNQRVIFVEQQRWIADSMVQLLEADTGFYTNTSAVTSRAPLEKLSYNEYLQATEDRLNDLARGSLETNSILQDVVLQLTRYKRILDEAGDCTITKQRWVAVEDALQLQLQLAKTQATQIGGLNSRVRQQVEAIKALTSQRDTQLNIEIAGSTKRDSELMRVIAVVTMLFLPATCIATIFSMTFFHLDQGGSLGVLVDGSIWKYAAVTVPITATLCVCYCMWSYRFDRSNSSLPRQSMEEV